MVLSRSRSKPKPLASSLNQRPSQLFQTVSPFNEVSGYKHHQHNRCASDQLASLKAKHLLHDNEPRTGVPTEIVTTRSHSSGGDTIPGVISLHGRDDDVASEVSLEDALQLQHPPAPTASESPLKFPTLSKNHFHDDSWGITTTLLEDDDWPSDEERSPHKQHRTMCAEASNFIRQNLEQCSGLHFWSQGQVHVQNLEPSSERQDTECRQGKREVSWPSYDEFQIHRSGSEQETGSTRIHI